MKVEYAIDPMRQGQVCVSIMASSLAAVQSALQSLQTLPDQTGQAEVVELRLDALQDPAELEACCAEVQQAFLVTVRAAWEGGLFCGSEEERLALLCRGLRAGAHFVDLELRTGLEHRRSLAALAKAQGAILILSHHDFSGTPDVAQLSALLEEMLAARAAGEAQAGKIVTTAQGAQSEQEVLRILCLQQQALAANFPLSAFAMGNIGVISRLATLYLGGFMSYAALDETNATAPGQLTLQTLCSLQRLLWKH